MAFVVIIPFCIDKSSFGSPCKFQSPIYIGKNGIYKTRNNHTVHTYLIPGILDCKCTIFYYTFSIS